MKSLPLIFDAHLDLSMNALEWNRDLRRKVSEIRESENGMTDKPDRGKGTVSFPSFIPSLPGVNPNFCPVCSQLPGMIGTIGKLDSGVPTGYDTELKYIR